MATDCIPQVAFEFEKQVVVKFDAEHTSTDGGAVLLKALDRQLGVTEAVASCLRDWRQRHEPDDACGAGETLAQRRAP